jgi:mono/diheme cytochrome c family protein
MNIKAMGLGAGLTIILGLIVAYFIINSGLIPANADGKPTALELWMAGTSLDATLKRYAPKTPNPVPLNDQNLLKGVELFAGHCAICHGTAKGEVDASPIARGEYPKPPQLGSDGVEDDPMGYSYWKIKHGIRLTGMPSFGDTLTDKQIWTLALFLKHMDKLPPQVQKAWLQVKNWPIQIGQPLQ